MKRFFKNTILQYIFWMLFFLFNRMVFLIFYSSTIAQEGISFKETLSTFYYALKLDTSTACYVLAISVIIWVIQSIFVNSKIIQRINLWFTVLFILIYNLIAAGDIGVYGEWKTKLSYKALDYLKHPSEVVESTSGWNVFILSAIVIITTILFIYIYRKFFYDNFYKHKSPVLSKVLSPIIVICFAFLGIRGGLQAIPISQSQSYFSKHNILNLAAVNNGYNIFFSMLNNAEYLRKNPFKSMPDSEANAIVKKLYEIPQDTTTSILKVEKPNIVIILLESWSADLIESLGGKAGITPQFRKLEKEGLLFTHHYASGNRSQQAIASIYSGFPAIPITTLTNHIEKYDKLPSMIKEMKEDGYYTSFYFGGELTYGNIKAYLSYNQFDKLVEVHDIDADIPRTRLGVPDGEMFPVYIDALKNEPQPFFSTIFTLSSHSPYDQPMKPVIDWAGTENPFINSAYYSDRSLGEFFEMAKKQAWYDNTLFVLVADHSHNTYRNWDLSSFDYHKTPLMFYGPALKDEYRGKQIDKIVSDMDLTTTLLKQLNLPADNFPYSKDIFNPTLQEFAYFELNIGFGWKRPFGEYVRYSLWNEDVKVEVDSTHRKQIKQEGKAYIQKVFQDFIDM
ncbi:MAG: LTA synthase family protein [Hyphomicrobiales bacterium]